MRPKRKDRLTELKGWKVRSKKKPEDKLKYNRKIQEFRKNDRNNRRRKDWFKQKKLKEKSKH